MNNEEAKFRLSAYRPGGQDAGDPALDEALALAERDPALRAWFAREQAFDAAVAAKMRTLAPPPGLREAILAGARIERRRASWLRPVGWAAAAMIAVALVVTALWQRSNSPDRLEALARFALEDLQQGRHGGHGEAMGALQAKLANPATRLAGLLPIDFAALAGSGCRTLHFAGRDVLEVCFERNGTELHFYVFPRADLPERLEPQALALGRATALAWSDQRFAYALVGNATAESLRKFL